MKKIILIIFLLLSTSNIHVSEILPYKINNNAFIIKELKIRDKYRDGLYDKFRHPEEITTIVIHGTGGTGTVNKLIEWMLNTDSRPGYCNGIGLFHYAIGRGEEVEDIKGIIIEIVNPRYWVHHANADILGAMKQIGIELCNPHRKNRIGYTKNQYDTLFIFIFDYLLKEYPNIEKIVSHRWSIWHYSKWWKAKTVDKRCPGPKFKWKLLEKEFKRRGYKYRNIGRWWRKGYKFWKK